MKIIKRYKLIYTVFILLIGMLAFSCFDTLECAYGEPTTDDSGVGTAIPDETNTPMPVNPPAPSGPTQQEPSNSSSANTGERVTTQSGTITNIDTRLSELGIACGNLVPAFMPDQYEYTVYVNKNSENKSCSTSAVAMDSANTTVSAEGPSEFESDDVQKKIIVEGNGGQKSEYIINIHVIKDTELLVDNVLYKISSPVNVKELPGNFKSADAKFKDEKIKVAKTEDGNLQLICFTNSTDDSDIKWYAIGDDGISLYQTEIREIDGEKYIVVFAGQEFMYGEHAGKIGYYIVDSQTGNIVFSILDNKKTEEAFDYHNMIMFVIIAVIIVIAFICISFALKRRQNSKKQASESKYFRPYIHIEENQKEIIGIADDMEEQEKEH